MDEAILDTDLLSEVLKAKVKPSHRGNKWAGISFRLCVFRRNKNKFARLMPAA
jgi:hypothetical protein